MKNTERVSHSWYYVDLLLSWCLRFVILTACLATMAMLAACKNGGDIDLTLKGNAAAKPPIAEVGKVN